MIVMLNYAKRGGGKIVCRNTYLYTVNRWESLILRNSDGRTGCISFTEYK